MENIKIVEIVADDKGKTSCGYFTEDAVKEALAMLEYRNPGIKFTVNPPLNLNVIRGEMAGGPHKTVRIIPDDGSAEWHGTDDSCGQYARNTGAKEFELYQATACADGLYVMSHKYIDLGDYTEEDLDDELAPYYGSVKGLEEAYDAPLSLLYGTVAECVFENICQEDVKAEGDGTLEEIIEEIEKATAPKRIWARVGMSAEVTAEEFDELKAAAKDKKASEAHGYDILRDLDIASVSWLEERFRKKGKIDGDGYIPSCILEGI